MEPTAEDEIDDEILITLTSAQRFIRRSKARVFIKSATDNPTVSTLGTDQQQLHKSKFSSLFKTKSYSQESVKCDAISLSPHSLEINTSSPSLLIKQQLEPKPTIRCKVCNEVSSGNHFGVQTCEGCRKAFMRFQNVKLPKCLGDGQKRCVMLPNNRKYNCKRCRFMICISLGMSKEAVQIGRPRKIWIFIKFHFLLYVMYTFFVVYVFIFCWFFKFRPHSKHLQIYY